MFGKAARQAVKKAVSGISRDGISTSLQELALETLQQIDEDDILAELGDDIGRGLLDRRYIVTEPTEIEVEILKFKMKFKVKIKIKAMRVNIHRRKSGTDSLELPEG